jgi:hypothetical protein
MVSAGARAFWGYTTNFVFYHRDPVPDDLVADDLAAAFLTMDVIIDRGILVGKTAPEIYQSVTNYVANVLPQLKTTAQRAVFLDNFAHLVCPATTWGDPTAHL